MLRTIIAGAAVAGAMTLGLVGVATAAGAASTPVPGSSAQGPLEQALCSNLPQLHSDVQALQKDVDSNVVPALQAAQTGAKDAGHTRAADALGRRITRVQNRQSRVEARLARAQARCQSASAGRAGSSTTTG
jgi:hypothetical protein